MKSLYTQWIERAPPSLNLPGAIAIRVVGATNSIHVDGTITTVWDAGSLVVVVMVVVVVVLRLRPVDFSRRVKDAFRTSQDWQPHNF